MVNEVVHEVEDKEVLILLEEVNDIEVLFIVVQKNNL